jgi:hypothetical protein
MFTKQGDRNIGRDVCVKIEIAVAVCQRVEGGPSLFRVAAV